MWIRWRSQIWHVRAIGENCEPWGYVTIFLAALDSCRTRATHLLNFYLNWKIFTSLNLHEPRDFLELIFIYLSWQQISKFSDLWHFLTGWNFAPIACPKWHINWENSQHLITLSANLTCVHGIDGITAAGCIGDAMGHGRGRVRVAHSWNHGCWVS